MNFLSELTYGTLSGGVKNGFLMYELVCNGLEPASDSALVEPFTKILEHGGKCKRVNISGDLPSAPAVSALIRVFHGSGFDIFVETTSIVGPPWWIDTVRSPAPLVTFLTVRLSDPHWAPYPFNELIYKISSSETPEPLMPSQLNPIAPLFLEGPSVKEMLSFAKRAHLRWNINCKVKPIKEYLYKEEGEEA